METACTLKRRCQNLTTTTYIKKKSKKMLIAATAEQSTKRKNTEHGYIFKIILKIIQFVF
jgi:hypothetical protein